MRSALLVLVCLAPLSACGRAGPAWPPDPAEVHLGEDACGHCRMIVSDGRFAAQSRTRDGATLVFDDLGCLLAVDEETALAPEAVFVRTLADDAWVRGTDAWTVRSEEIASPMGSGLAAFAGRDAAAAEARRRPGASLAPLAEMLGPTTSR